MSSQAKVGLLFLLTIGAIFVFVSFLGQISLFGNYEKITVAFNFAGGLAKGSHVRVMGIKVGKVEDIIFTPDYKTPEGEEVKLQAIVKIQSNAFKTIREDSKFYINQAGIIGEKYLEISPGSSASPQLASGSFSRGVDPPRIDQLISQGYALAGKILSVVEENEGSVTDTIGSINGLVGNLNKVLGTIDKLTTNRKYNEVFQRISLLTKELTIFVQEVKAGDTKRSVRSIRKILGKLEKINEKDIRDFLQEEGIKARVAL